MITKGRKLASICLVLLGASICAAAPPQSNSPEYYSKDNPLFDLRSVDTKPAPTMQVAPVLPEELKSAGLKGTVTVEFVISKTCITENIVVLNSSDSRLIAPTVAAVRQWRYRPALRKREPVNCRVAQTIEFRAPGPVEDPAPNLETMRSALGLSGGSPAERFSLGPHEGIGITSVDSRWKDYTGYIHTLEQRVVAEWYHLCNESRVLPPHDSYVNVKFTINSGGETEIVKVEDVGCGKQGVTQCERALESGKPYPPWPEEMIAVLGQSQTLVFRFYYR